MIFNSLKECHEYREDKRKKEEAKKQEVKRPATRTKKKEEK